MLKPVLALLLGGPFAAPAAASEAMSLQDTFDAYMQVITQNDTQARTTLTNSLRMADPDVFPAVPGMADDIYAFRQFIASFGEQTAAIVRTRLKAVHCQAAHVSTDEADVYYPGTVEYRCVIPDVSAYFEDYREHHVQLRTGTATPARINGLLDRYAAVLRDAPDLTYEGKARFFRAGSGGPWASSDLRFLGAELVVRLMPVQDWDRLIEAEAGSSSTATSTDEGGSHAR
ncbi:hypothetical protein [Stenotrophomonas sp. ATs4]|uniref:hypothetical protein n=1 Tax=Stenotrophomonas sp. ATs4 TaxID=3402766 RepID=UPI003F7159C8